MPVKPKPFTLKCEHCGWSKTFSPVSDVVMFPEKGPECGNTELTNKKHSHYSFASIFGEKR